MMSPPTSAARGLQVSSVFSLATNQQQFDFFFFCQKINQSKKRSKMTNTTANVELQKNTENFNGRGKKTVLWPMMQLYKYSLSFCHQHFHTEQQNVTKLLQWQNIEHKKIVIFVPGSKRVFKSICSFTSDFQKFWFSSLFSEFSFWVVMINPIKNHRQFKFRQHEQVFLQPLKDWRQGGAH